jgi:hypothetical protein
LTDNLLKTVDFLFLKKLLVSKGNLFYKNETITFKDFEKIIISRIKNKYLLKQKNFKIKTQTAQIRDKIYKQCCLTSLNINNKK